MITVINMLYYSRKIKKRDRVKRSLIVMNALLNRGPFSIQFRSALGHNGFFEFFVEFIV
jgi:hypothetical protein